MIRAGLSKCGARFETIFRDPTQWCVEISGVHGVMIEIGDVTKARPVRVTPRPLQRRFQWTTPLHPTNQKIATLINTSSRARHRTSLIRREVRVYYLRRGEVLSAVIVDIQSRKLGSSSKVFYFSRPGLLDKGDVHKWCHTILGKNLPLPPPCHISSQVFNPPLQI